MFIRFFSGVDKSTDRNHVPAGVFHSQELIRRRIHTIIHISLGDHLKVTSIGSKIINLDRPIIDL